MFGKIFYFLLSVFLTIFILEFFLQYSESTSPSLSELDPVLGTTLKKNKAYTYFNEGFSMGYTNKFGYYGPGYSEERTNNSLRIALMGDSYVEGHQLFDRNHFRSILEREISKKTNKKVQVLNFGMSGFDLNDSYCYYMNFANKFKPNLVVYVLESSDFERYSNKDRRPTCYIDNDSLKISYDFRKSKSYNFAKQTSFIRGRSQVIRLIYNDFILIKKGAWKSIVFDKFYLWNGSHNNHYSNIQELKYDLVTKAIVKEIGKEQNAIFLLRDSIHQSIKNDIISNNIQYLNVNDTLNTEIKNGKNPHYWNVTGQLGHWNIDANSLIGEYLANKIIHNLNKAKENK